MTIEEAAQKTAAESRDAPKKRARKSTSPKKTADRPRNASPRPPKPQPDTKGAWIREQCTKADLSLLMNVSMRTLTDMDSQGRLVRAPKAGLYLTRPTLNACWDHIRLIAAGRLKDAEDPAKAERLKTDTIERQIREITLKKLNGEVLTLEEVDESWSTFAGQVKAAILTVPSKARSKIPHLTAHDQETLRTIVKDMLIDLAAEVEASVIGGAGEDIIA